jgi:hypothetical protein
MYSAVLLRKFEESGQVATLERRMTSAVDDRKEKTEQAEVIMKAAEDLAGELGVRSAPSASNSRVITSEGRL